MILGSESVLYEYIKGKNSDIVFIKDEDLSKELGVSVASIGIYKRKLKEYGLLEIKQVYRNKIKTTAYKMKGDINNV